MSKRSESSKQMEEGNTRARQMAHKLVENGVALRDQPHIEVEKQGGGGEVRQGGEFRQRAARQHLLESLEFAALRRLVEKRQRIGKTEPVVAAHQ